jgi:hypothetical protein
MKNIRYISMNFAQYNWKMTCILCFQMRQQKDRSAELQRWPSVESERQRLRVACLRQLRKQKQ